MRRGVISDRNGLCVSRRIVIGVLNISAGRDDLPVQDDHRTDALVPFGRGDSCFGQRRMHELFMCL
jgi:hypothetical protein